MRLPRACLLDLLRCLHATVPVCSSPARGGEQRTEAREAPGVRPCRAELGGVLRPGNQGLLQGVGRETFRLSSEHAANSSSPLVSTRDPETHTCGRPTRRALVSWGHAFIQRTHAAHAFSTRMQRTHAAHTSTALSTGHAAGGQGDRACPLGLTHSWPK